MQRTTVSANVLTGFAELARSHGVDPVTLLRASRVPSAALTDPEVRLSLPAIVRLLEASARACDCPDLGLQLSRLRRLSHLGAAGLMARDEPDVRRALRAITSWFHLHSEVVLQVIEQEGTATVMTVLPPRAMSVQVSDLVLGGIYQVLLRLLGPGWAPLRVSSVHAAPVDPRPYRRYFRCAVEFEAPFNGLVLDAADLERPLADADPVFREALQRQLMARLNRKPLQDQVAELITVMLPTGGCSMERVALRLGLEVRTLRRHLARHGTTFSESVDDTRRVLARQYLQEEGRSVRSVAELLGFSETSAFTRWCKRSLGRVPSQFQGRP